jgi:biotin synthase
VKAEPLMDVEAVLHSARTAREAGATRFCMGAAWRHVKDGRSFDSVLEMVSGVKDLGMEACVTLGMINASQAKRLKEAGLTSYNHNLDTSPEHYAKVISTRTYEERLDTIKNVREAGIEVCCGGILGLGESEDDRAGLLMTLANLPEHPGSVPINALVAVTGTPLENEKGVQSTELVRAIATARIMMPKSMVRLSAGRQSLNEEAQLLCFMAGANSIFYGEKLLTTANPELAADRAMMERAGVEALEPRV